MKRFILMAIAITLFAGLGFSQQVKKHLVFVLNERADKFNEQVKINDFVYIIEDSTMYCSKVALGPNATGTYLLASTSRYNVANMTVIAGVVTASSGTFSTTLSVAGAVGVTGVATIQGQTMTADHVNNMKFGNSLTATDTLFGPVVYAGLAGTDGKIVVYSEQGATDYLATINPNSAMTSAANFYLPADEPGATYPLTVTTGGVMGYNNQAVTTTSDVKFDSLYLTDELRTLSAYADDSISLPLAGIFKLGGHQLSWNNQYYLQLNHGLILDENLVVADESFLQGLVKFDSNLMIQKKYYLAPYYLAFALEDTVGIEMKIKLQNLSDIAIQNKAGNGQVTVMARDTTPSTAKVNISNVNLATIDSTRVNRVIISDTLQGLVLYTSTGVKYRLRVSPTGVLSIVAVP